MLKVGRKKSASSVAEGERPAGSLCVQDFFCEMMIVESIKSKVKKSIKSHIDNEGAGYLANNWSFGERVRNCEIKDHFLRCKKYSHN